MKKYLVLYYSKTGNSRFLAEKIASGLGADLKRVDPLFKGLLVLNLLSALKLGVAVNVRKDMLAGYDELIIIGPIWGGQLIPPLRSMLRQAIRAAKPIHFAVSCGSSDEKKDSHFGYAGVLREAEAMGPDLVRSTEAFSMALVNEAGTQGPKAGESLKLSESNYKGPIQARLEAFLARIASGRASAREILH